MNITEGTQRRAVKTRQRILVSAARLFAERGYHGVGISEIARASSSSKGAFYFHFPEKRDVAEAIIVTHHERFRDLVARANPHEDLNGLIQVQYLSVHCSMHDPLTLPVGRLLTESERFHAHARALRMYRIVMVERSLSNAKKAGWLRAGTELRTVSTVLSSAFDVPNSPARAWGGPDGAMGFVRVWVPLLMRGLVTEEAYEKLELDPSEELLRTEFPDDVVTARSRRSSWRSGAEVPVEAAPPVLGRVGLPSSFHADHSSTPGL